MIPCCVLRSTLKHAMEVVSLLLPLLSMVWRPWRAPPTIPNAEARLQPYGIRCEGYGHRNARCSCCSDINAALNAFFIFRRSVHPNAKSFNHRIPHTPAHDPVKCGGYWISVDQLFVLRIDVRERQ
ncbi:hypothetical protein U9M48_034464 [Paspalum notatum var. saurae]|uniref:Secreted protein n=1 Tax=Paspalum notatum var. saurae TaxID=547442 RepID=A0AAQ3UAJ6_PASNO